MGKPSPHRSSAANQRTFDYDVDDYRGCLDTKEFRLYCVEVRKAIKAAGDPRGASIAEIHRALGEAANRDWTMDAIESLVAVQEIAQVSFVSPIRFAARHERQTVKAHSYGRDELREWV